METSVASTAASPPPTSKTVTETKNLLRRAFEEDETATTPFRGESEATSAWRALCKKLGPPFLAQVLGESPQGEPAEAAAQILDACYQSVERVHPHIRECLAAASSDRPEDRRKARLAQRNLFFLRFLCSACIHPSDWGLPEDRDDSPKNSSKGNAAPSLSPTRRASVGKELIQMTSDVTSSSGAVQVFLDRLVDLGNRATVHRMDLRHFLHDYRTVSSSSSSNDSSSTVVPVVRCPKGGPLGSPGPSSSSKDKKGGGSSIKKKKKSKKSNAPSVTPFDCFWLPAAQSSFLEATSSPRPLEDSGGQSPKLPFDRRLQDLDADGLAKFLFDAGLPHLIDVFRRNSFTGNQLATVSERDLEALGLSREQRVAVVKLVARHL